MRRNHRRRRRLPSRPSFEPSSSATTFFWSRPSISVVIYVCHFSTVVYNNCLTRRSGAFAARLVAFRSSYFTRSSVVHCRRAAAHSVVSCLLRCFAWVRGAITHHPRQHQRHNYSSSCCGRCGSSGVDGEGGNFAVATCVVRSSRRSTAAPEPVPPLMP